MNRYKAHQELLNHFKLELQKVIPTIRIFNRHVGMFYTANGTPVMINTAGMADMYAWYPSKFGPINIEIEIKSGNAKQSTAQKNWERFYKTLNGFYIVVNDIPTGVKEIKNYVDALKKFV